MFGLRDDRTIVLFSQSVFGPSELARATRLLRGNGIPLAALRGRYKGNDEPAYAAPLEYMAFVAGFGWLTDQETVLLVEPNGAAWLRPASAWPLTRAAGRHNRDVLLGAFKRITETEALAADGYTFDPVKNSYWGIDTDVPMLHGAPSITTEKTDA